MKKVIYAALVNLLIAFLCAGCAQKKQFLQKSIDTSLSPICQEDSKNEATAQICPVITARVFIHGTILAGYFFVDIPASWKDAHKENSLIERAIAAARKHSFLYHTELVLETGLVDVTHEIKVPLDHTLQDSRAAISILRIFERTNQSINQTQQPVHYYTFGWSGALSERKRNNESQNLYQALIQLQKKLLAQYPGALIRFELFGYSHGGQLIAHLPIVHKQFPENRLFIDLVVLCATPLYKEKIQPMVSSSLFGTIISLYSAGDMVQNMDFISTPQHFCVRNFQELGIPLPQKTAHGPTILDICLSVHGNNRIFKHQNFFNYSIYAIPSHTRKRSYIKKTINFFDPLPLLALFPAYYHGLKQTTFAPGFHQLAINFRHNQDNLIVETHHLQTSCTWKHLYHIKPLSHNFLQEHKKRARKTIFNQFKHALYHLMHN